MSEDDRNLLRELCNLEIPNVIKFSPYSQKVVYSTHLYWGHYAGKHPVSTLWLASTGEPNSSRKLTSGQFNDCNPAWNPNGKSIAFVSDRAKPGEKWAIYSLQTTEDDNAAEPLTSVENLQPISAFAFSPDGTQIAFISSDEKTAEHKKREEDEGDVQVWGEDWPYARLRIVDLQSKKVRSMVLDRHVTGLSWSPEGTRLAFSSTKTPDIEEPELTGTAVSVVDARTLTSVQDVFQFPGRFSDLTWAKDGKLYFVGTYPADTIFTGHALYATDPNMPSPSYERLAFGIDNDATGLTQADGKIVVKLENRLEGGMSLLDTSVLYSEKEELEAFDVAVAPNSQGEYVLAFATSNINRPVEVFTRTARAGGLTQLSNHGAAFKNRVFGTCHFLSCLSTNEEVEIDSMYLVPAAVANKRDLDGTVPPPKRPLPTVVLIHGGPTTRLTNAFNSYYYYLAPYLLSLGYGVLIPNYRGSSGRGHRFGAYSIGGAGTHDYADVVSATENAVQRGYADKERLLVGGYSHGGFLSLLCSVRNGMHSHGWKFQAAVAGSSISDIDGMALTCDLGSSFQPALCEGRVIWNMARNDTRNRDASALWLFREAVERSQKTGEMVVPPMLILHGAEDRRCHVSQAWGVRRALESQGLPFEMVTYPRQGHLLGEQKFWIDNAVRVGRWCRTYIGDGDCKE